MSILFYILWINFVRSRPFGIICGKSTLAGKSTPAPLVALLTNKSYDNVVWVICVSDLNISSVWERKHCNIIELQNRPISSDQGHLLALSQIDQCGFSYGKRRRGRVRRCKPVQLSLSSTCTLDTGSLLPGFWDETFVNLETPWILRWYLKYDNNNMDVLGRWYAPYFFW